MANGWVKRNPWIFVVGPLAIALFTWGFGEVVRSEEHTSELQSL